MFKKFFTPLLIVILSFILVVIWFRGGLLLGAAESGLPFYSLERNEKITRWAWAEPGLGNYTGTLSATWPTYWALSQLEKAGLPGFLIEALVFWVLLSTAGISIYFLTKDVFPNINNKYAFLASLFYLFNPLSLVNVWHRFLINSMFFLAFYPLAVFLFLRGLNKRDYKFAFYIGVSSLLFSFAFGAITSTILLWLTFFLLLVFTILLEKPRTKGFSIKFFLFSLVIFFVFHLWWIDQALIINLSSDVGVAASRFATTSGNLDSLKSISKTLGWLTNTVRFLHGTFFELGQPWANSFVLVPVVIIEFIFSGLIFWTIYKFHKKKKVILLGSLFIISLFLTKGSNPPFGEIFSFLFVNFPPLQLFRNPFEKFSFLLLLSSTLLFVYGLQKLEEIVRGKTAYIFSLLFVVLFWGFPFWTGLVFSANEQVAKEDVFDYKVGVPAYYKEANKWFKKQGTNFRFISLPIGGEGIIYDWEDSYQGVELSYVLFANPSISSNTTVPYFSEVAGGLEEFFLSFENFENIMNRLNVRYILVREDIDWRKGNMRDPTKITEFLEENPDKYGMVAKFDALNIWENKNWRDSKLQVSKFPFESVPESSIFDLEKFRLPEDALLVDGTVDVEKQGLIVSPQTTFFTERQTSAGFEIRQDLFPHARFLPSSSWYKLVLLKEKIELFARKDLREKADWQIALLGKRLTEAKSEVDGNNPKGAETALSYYRKQLEDLEDTLRKINEPTPLSERKWRQEDLYTLFSRHIVVLEELEKVIPNDVATTKQALKNSLMNAGIFPKYDYIETSLFPVQKRNTFQFHVSEKGEYELRLRSANWMKFFDMADKNLTFQIDGEVAERGGITAGQGFVSYGKFHFEKGIHEVGFNTPLQKNLVLTPEEIDLSVNHGVEEAKFEIENFDPYTSYEVSLDYWIRRGSGLEVAIKLNNDEVKGGQLIPHFSKFLPPDNYNFDVRNYSFTFSPSRGSDTAHLALIVKPWNDCESIYWSKGRSKCEDPEFRRQYDRTTEVLIKNISVRKMITEEPMLFSVRPTDLKELPKVRYIKIDPTEYKVEIFGANSPFFLVLSELFNSGWQVQHDDGLMVSGENHFLANGYANGWIIEKQGDYSLTIKFKPQDSLENSRKISLVAIILGFVIFGVAKIRNKDEKS